MTNIKKVAAGMIAGAAITVAPLVAFAAPAFAATGIDGSGTPHNRSEQHVLADHAPFGSVAQWPTSSAPAGQSDASPVLVNAASSGSLRDGNAARCGGGINC
jgi:hypothetical protein